MLLAIDPDRPLHTVVHVSESSFYLGCDRGEFDDARDAVGALGADRVVRIVRRGLCRPDCPTAPGLLERRSRRALAEKDEAHIETDELEGLVRAAREEGQLSMLGPRGEVSMAPRRRNPRSGPGSDR